MTLNFNLFSFINYFIIVLIQDFYFSASLSQNTAILGRVLGATSTFNLKKKKNGAGIRKRQTC